MYRKSIAIRERNTSIKSMATDQNVPIDVFSLRYGASQWKYTRQLVDGNIAGNTQGAWSLTRNDKTYSV